MRELVEDTRGIRSTSYAFLSYANKYQLKDLYGNKGDEIDYKYYIRYEKALKARNLKASERGWDINEGNLVTPTLKTLQRFTDKLEYQSSNKYWDVTEKRFIDNYLKTFSGLNTYVVDLIINKIKQLPMEEVVKKLRDAKKNETDLNPYNLFDSKQQTQFNDLEKIFNFWGVEYKDEYQELIK